MEFQFLERESGVVEEEEESDSEREREMSRHQHAVNTAQVTQRGTIHMREESSMPSVLFEKYN